MPADRRGLFGVRRAYAVVGVDDLILTGGLLAFLNIAFAGAGYAANESLVEDQDAKAAIDQAAYDEFSSAYASSAQWLYDNSGTYINETASGWQVDTSAIPDSVINDVQSFAATSAIGTGLTAGVVPSTFTAKGYGTYRPSSNTYIVAPDLSITLSGDLLSSIESKISYLPYVTFYARSDSNTASVLYPYVIMSDSPITLNSVTGQMTPTNYRARVSYNFSTTGSYAEAGLSGGSVANATSFEFSTGSIPTQTSGGKTWSNGNFMAFWFATCAAYSAASVAQSPSAISDAMAQLQDAISNAEDTTAQLQAALDAVRAGNPQISIPSDGTTVINNYNEYVTYTTATPADPSSTDTPTIDMGALADAISAALGAGATLADILAIISGWGIDTDMADVLDLLLNISNKIESDLDRQSRQQSLDADLDEIIRLLSSINETATAILNDMRNLDRSTNDLVDLSPLVVSVTGSHGTDALGLYGRLDTVLNWLDSYSPPDLSNIEQTLEDWPEYPVFDPDGIITTITGSHGTDALGIYGRLDTVLNWLDSYSPSDLSDIETYLSTLLGFSTVTAEGSTYSFSDLLYNLWLDVADIGNNLVEYWAEVVGRLDDVIQAIEDLPHGGTHTYPSEPSDPEGGPIIGPIDLDPYGYPKMPDWETYKEPLNIPALQHAIDELMTKFPFSMLNTIVQVAAYIERPPVAPQFDIPAPNPSDWSSPHMVHVDLSDYDTVAATLRFGIVIWAIVRISNRTIKMWMGDKAVE